MMAIPAITDVATNGASKSGVPLSVVYVDADGAEAEEDEDIGVDVVDVSENAVDVEFTVCTVDVEVGVCAVDVEFSVGALDAVHVRSWSETIKKNLVCVTYAKMYMYMYTHVKYLINDMVYTSILYSFEYAYRSRTNTEGLSSDRL